MTGLKFIRRPKPVVTMSGDVSAPTQTSVSHGVLEELLGRWRLALLIGVLLLELALFFLASSAPLDPATRQALQGEAKNLTGDTHGLTPAGLFSFIFTHNAVVALGEMIPALGGLLWLVSIYATGQVIQVVALSNGAPGPLYAVFILLLPFAIVELSAYALALTSGTMLIVAWRRHTLHREARVLLLEAMMVLALLLTAAAMETVTIINPAAGFALWAPMGIAVAILVLAYKAGRRRMSDASLRPEYVSST